MIKNLRVDHRLLHGQVAFSWTSALGADCILIACDDVMKDDIRKMSNNSETEKSFSIKLYTSFNKDWAST